jgi:hypothetical protein
MLQAVQLIISTLQGIRNDAKFSDLLKTTLEFIKTNDLGELELPRARRPPARLTGNAAAHVPSTLQDHYRPQFYNFVETAINQLKERFTDSGDLLQYRSLEDVFIQGATDTTTRDLLAPYTEIDFAQYSIQMPLFHNMNYTTVSDAVKLLQSMSPEMRALFCEVENFIRLLLVSPASSSEAERSFSALRRLKTWLRSSTSQERLNDLAVCNIHRDILDNLDINLLMTEFTERGRDDIRKKTFGRFC